MAPSNRSAPMPLGDATLPSPMLEAVQAPAATTHAVSWPANSPQQAPRFPSSLSPDGHPFRPSGRSKAQQWEDSSPYAVIYRDRAPSTSTPEPVKETAAPRIFLRFESASTPCRVPRWTRMVGRRLSLGALGGTGSGRHVDPVERCLRISGSMFQLLLHLSPRCCLPSQNVLFPLLRARAPLLRVPAPAHNMETAEACR